MDALYGFLGALIGGAAAGLINWFYLDKQHDQAKELQDRQFEQAGLDREAEWDRQREERDQQRELDRQREADRAQLEAIRQLELVLPSFSRSARAIYEARQERRKAELAGMEDLIVQRDLDEYVAQFNDLRYVAMGAITKIADPKLRKRAGHLYLLDEAMALSFSGYWDPGREVFGGNDPVMLQVNWQEQMLSMSGKLYRGESIEADYVEENLHVPDPQRSE